jgi:polysaccharide biosynthesis protein PslH
VRILTLALGVPFPAFGGGLTRTFHLLRALAPRHDLVLAAFTYGEQHEPPPFPVAVKTAPWQWSRDYEDMIGADAGASRQAVEKLSYESEDPWFISASDPRGMEDVLRQVLDTHVDLVLFEGTPLARFLPMMPPEIPRVLDLLDVHSAIARRAADAAPGDGAHARREAERTLMFERAAAGGCDLCLAVSPEEAASARELLAVERVEVVPNGVDTSFFTPSAAPEQDAAMLFTGRMNYDPNADAVRDFVEEILPLVRRDIPQARLHVVGTDPPARVTSLASEAVTVHGRVADVRPYLEAAAVVVVPVRHGGGTRLKVLEAAAAGKSIVSTRLGVEGLAFRHGSDLLVADSPADFAAAVVALLRDAGRRAELGTRARAVASQYDWTAIGEGFERILQGLAGPRRHGGGREAHKAGFSGPYQVTE